MLIEIHDIPNNQTLKSLDIHIDFENSKTVSTWEVEKLEKNESKKLDIKEKDDKVDKVIIDDITEEQIKTTEIPREMTDASF